MLRIPEVDRHLGASPGGLGGGAALSSERRIDRALKLQVEELRDLATALLRKADPPSNKRGVRTIEVQGPENSYTIKQSLRGTISVKIAPESSNEQLVSDTASIHAVRAACVALNEHCHHDMAAEGKTRPHSVSLRRETVDALVRIIDGALPGKGLSVPLLDHAMIRSTGRVIRENNSVVAVHLNVDHNEAAGSKVTFDLTINTRGGMPFLSRAIVRRDETNGDRHPLYDTAGVVGGSPSESSHRKWKAELRYAVAEVVRSCKTA